MVNISAKLKWLKRGNIFRKNLKRKFNFSNQREYNKEFRLAKPFLFLKWRKIII